MMKTNNVRYRRNIICELCPAETECRRRRLAALFVSLRVAGKASRMTRPSGHVDLTRLYVCR